MPKIKVEHVQAKIIMRKLKENNIPFKTTSDSSQARFAMPTNHRAGTFGMGVTTTISVRPNNTAIFDDICMEALKAGVEQEAPPRRSIRYWWPFSLLSKKE
ncbi:MAG: hypothetical protein ACK46A_12325 [Akkermansiaceae bacterium]|jgi:hypothetical protein